MTNLETVKHCTKCRTNKDRSEFHRNRSRDDGLSTWCSDCSNAYMKTPARMKQHRKIVKRLRVKKRSHVTKYKAERGCQRCGESDTRCLQLHHIDPTKKVGAVSRLIADNVPLERIQAELEKCEVLCANCHMKEHYLWQA